MSTPLPKGTATIEELIRRAELGEAVELVDGEIVEKTQPSGRHGATQAKLGEVLGPIHRRGGGSRGPGGWWIMFEIETLYAKTREVFRHDAIGYRRDLHPERPDDWPVTARPDWACEILSTSNARRDLVQKQRTLHRHGVPHSWIVDPANETLMALRWAEAAYVVAATAGVGDVVRAEPFEVIEISIAELFGRED